MELHRDENPNGTTPQSEDDRNNEQVVNEDRIKKDYQKILRLVSNQNWKRAEETIVNHPQALTIGPSYFIDEEKNCSYHETPYETLYETPLDMSIGKNAPVEFIDLLLKHGGLEIFNNMSLFNPSGVHAEYLYLQDLKYIKVFVENLGVDVICIEGGFDDEGYQKGNQLHCALYHNAPLEVINYFITMGKDNVVNGKIPPHEGFNMFSREKNEYSGMTTLMLACQLAYPLEVIKGICENGYDLESEDFKTVLYCACNGWGKEDLEICSLDVIQYLLTLCGEDAVQTPVADNRGNALSVACIYAPIAVVELLAERGGERAVCMSRMEYNYTPLFNALMMNRLDVASVLVENCGVSIIKFNKEGGMLVLFATYYDLIGKFQNIRSRRGIDASDDVIFEEGLRFILQHVNVEEIVSNIFRWTHAPSKTCSAFNAMEGRLDNARVWNLITPFLHRFNDYVTNVVNAVIISTCFDLSMIEEPRTPSIKAPYNPHNDTDDIDCTIFKNFKPKCLHRESKLTTPKRVLIEMMSRFPGCLSLPDEEGRLPIHIACERGCEWELIALLLDSNPQEMATVDGKTNLCAFALAAAAFDIEDKSCDNNLNTVYETLRRFPDQCLHRVTDYHESIENQDDEETLINKGYVKILSLLPNKNWNIAKEIIMRHPKICESESGVYSVLAIAIENKAPLDFIDFLLKTGGKNIVCELHGTSLLDYFYTKELDFIKLFIRTGGVDIICKTSYIGFGSEGNQLHAAMYFDVQMEVIKYFILKGGPSVVNNTISPNKTNRTEYPSITTLMLACRKAYSLDIIESIISVGYDIDAEPKHLMLYCACNGWKKKDHQTCSLSVIKYLMKFCDAEAVQHRVSDHRGNALSVACIYAPIEVVEYLTEIGGEVAVCTTNRNLFVSPLMNALAMYRLDVASILVSSCKNKIFRIGNTDRESMLVIFAICDVCIDNLDNLRETKGIDEDSSVIFEEGLRFILQHSTVEEIVFSLFGTFKISYHAYCAFQIMEKKLGDNAVWDLIMPSLRRCNQNGLNVINLLIETCWSQDVMLSLRENLLEECSSNSFASIMGEIDQKMMKDFRFRDDSTRSAEVNDDEFTKRVLGELVQRFPECVENPDKDGRLPIHVACEKGFDSSFIDLVYPKNKDALMVKDGKTELCAFALAAASFDSEEEACDNDLSLIFEILRKCPQQISKRVLHYQTKCCMQIEDLDDEALIKKNYWKILILVKNKNWNNAKEIILRHPIALREGQSLYKEKLNESPLGVSISKNAPLGFIRYLLQVGGRKIIKEIGPFQGIHILSCYNADIEVFKLFLQTYGEEVIFFPGHFQQNRRANMLFNALNNNASVDAVHHLLDIGGEEIVQNFVPRYYKIYEEKYSAVTALMLACKKCHPLEVVKRITSYSNLDTEPLHIVLYCACNGWGNTDLQICSLEVIRFIAELRIDSTQHQVSDDRGNALSVACIYAPLDVVKYLTEIGGEVAICTPKINSLHTPLMNALMMYRLEVAIHLVESCKESIFKVGNEAKESLLTVFILSYSSIVKLERVRQGKGIEVDVDTIYRDGITFILDHGSIEEIMFSLFGIFHLYNDTFRAFWILEHELPYAWDLIMPFLHIVDQRTNVVSALIEVFSSKAVTLEPARNEVDEDEFHPFEDTGDIDEELMKNFDWRPHNDYQFVDMGDLMYKWHLLHELIRNFPHCPFSPDTEGRFPIHIACEKGLELKLIGKLFEENPASVMEKDGKTMLPPFMLAAASCDSEGNPCHWHEDIVYHVLKMNPDQVLLVDWDNE